MRTLVRNGYRAGQRGTNVHDYPIVSLKPANQELGFKAKTLEVSLLLPAIQKVREAAAWVQLVGEGWDIAIPVSGRSDRSKMAKIVL